MYLSKLLIQNFRGIEYLELNFNPSINIIIGENGSCKSAVIDAIRLLYNIGEPLRSITVSQDDFYEKLINTDDGQIQIQTANNISITYEFRGLSTSQKGALYEYMVLNPENKDDHAKVRINYENKGGKYPVFSYSTGATEGQRSDYKTFELFKHYYLGALRDSTKDLLNTKGNILGKVIKRHVDRNETGKEIEKIMAEANDNLLKRPEVVKTRTGVNENLESIFKKFIENKIGLQIESSKVEYILNVIKPFLPHNKKTLKDEGFRLQQNSLGFNNLIYIATVLGDINEEISDNNILHYALLIEEPEAHLHPQLQLNLYNFLKNANKSENGQLFVTSHSPTLTSKVPLDNLILLDAHKAFIISHLFEDRVKENLIEDTAKNTPLTASDFNIRKKKLERYIDVTKSQLFFSKSILFVEGISEELLISAFTSIEDYQLEDYRIELVNVKGTSFYPFMYLFNSITLKKKIEKKVTILTDDDRYTASKESRYSFNNLIKDDYALLDELEQNICKGETSKRILNLSSLKNNASSILIKYAYKTLEYEIALHNVATDRRELQNNLLFSFLSQKHSDKINKVDEYVKTFKNDKMSDEEKRKVAILVWKSMGEKAEFAQDFSLYLLEHIDSAKVNFKVPPYIVEGLNHLKNHDF